MCNECLKCSVEQLDELNNGYIGQPLRARCLCFLFHPVRHFRSLTAAAVESVEEEKKTQQARIRANSDCFRFSSR